MGGIGFGEGGSCEQFNSVSSLLLTWHPWEAFSKRREAMVVILLMIQAIVDLVDAS